MSKFTIDIEKWANKTGNTLIETNTAALVQLNSSIIMGTPVDKGQHRGSWQASIGAPSSAKGSPDKSGNATLAKANAIAAKSVPGVYYLTSNAPAIRKIEYGTFTSKPSTAKTINGFSRLAPRGMVRLAFMRLRLQINLLGFK